MLEWLKVSLESFVSKQRGMKSYSLNIIKVNRAITFQKKLHIFVS